MKIALFSDLHGKLLLPFKLVDLYQQETGKKIDAILQCGDMGCYPNLDNLDKATLKHAKKDRDELGFHDYFVKEVPKVNRFLSQLNVDMICVRGNHEDHDYLDQLEQEASAPLFPIDVYKRVFVCKTGHKQVLQVGDETLSFVGVGRIGDRKGRTNDRFIQPYEKKCIQQLIKQNNEVFDVLITHDKDADSERGYGMQEINNLLDEVIFKYHFYGHTGEPYQEQMHENGITTSIKIKEAEFNRSGILEEGAMMILEKNNSSITVEAVDQKITNKLTKFNWNT